MTHRAEADRIYDGIYGSYLKAEPYFKPLIPDRIKRSPGLLEGFFKEYKADHNVVITGSKGKGSVARMIAALMSLRLECGLMVSPHVSDYLDRVSCNGEIISEEDFIRIGKKTLLDVKGIRTDERRGEYISPTGLWALIGMRYFEEKACDINILECGKGARYDDVNRIPHRYAVIGTIFLEHTKELGKTIEEIAEDKASVIKEGVRRVYVMPQESRVMDIIQERCSSYDTKLVCGGRDFFAENIRQDIDGVTADITGGGRSIKNVRLSMTGGYQAMHAALAMAFFLDYIEERYKSEAEGMVSAKEMSECLGSVKIAGRMEIVSRKPLCILDSSINKKSADWLVGVLKDSGIGKAAVILCIPDDKDVTGVAEAVKETAKVIILTRLEHPHYPMVKDWHKILKETGINTVEEENLTRAYERAAVYDIPIVILTSNAFVHYVGKMLKNSNLF